jgi:hypothetical protein
MRYFKGDYASVNEILGIWDRFVDKLSIACKDNVPVYKSKPKYYYTPWMDKDTLVTVQNKRKKWKKYNIRILSLASALEKIIEYKCPTHG